MAGGVLMAGGNTGGIMRAPRLLLLIMAVTGSALLALNLAIIVCFVKRRNREQRSNGKKYKSNHHVSELLMLKFHRI